MRKVIFDVDGDADNLLTVSAALCDPSLDVLGITTVHGMDSAADAAEHIRALLDGMSVSRPVIEGAGAPLMPAAAPEWRLPTGWRGGCWKVRSR